ncbi:Na+/H+ antiporter NhaC family protein [Calycomorphotria hydatis]|uniref:Na+/H+ antiporter NhaC family protein n=1 Tax=Calycomorphotria hydatis TaxID=2528027 RepID=UPI0018D21D7C|nr:Na+/H+ antiporter NhaC family protein [Calycomorphotria hydatis]
MAELRTRSAPSLSRLLFSIAIAVITLTIPDVAWAAESTETITHHGWFSLVPPLAVLVLAVLTRQVIVALLGAIYVGALPFVGWNPFAALLRMVDTYIVGELVSVDGSPGDPFHVQVILFTLFLGALVAVMTTSGGTAGLIAPLLPYAKTRERGQLLTWLMGFLVFFDDYANTILLGGTVRPLTDRLGISREKLAFLIDSTAAPIAGLAIVSTWVGVEIGYVSDAYQQAGLDVDGYTIFLATTPYRFYPIFLLVFVYCIAWTGRDYGPMRTAELKTLKEGGCGRDNVSPPVSSHSESTSNSTEGNLAPDPSHPKILNAVLPLVVLIAGLLIGMLWTGVSSIHNENSAGGNVPFTLWDLLDRSDPTRMLLLSSFGAWMTAVGMAVATRANSLAESIAASLAGMRSMIEVSTILVLAWTLATLCNSDHLGTADFLVSLSEGVLSVSLLPAIAFVISGVVALCTGSSWSTMGLLIPIFVPVAANLLAGQSDAEVDPFNTVLLATTGAILAGAIFGDHCSPISDTTILSSGAAGCDHLAHVSTQMPYALTVGGIALFAGYLPVGFGVPWWILLPAGPVIIYALVRTCGKRLD